MYPPPPPPPPPPLESAYYGPTNGYGAYAPPMPYVGSYPYADTRSMRPLYSGMRPSPQPPYYEAPPPPPMPPMHPSPPRWEHPPPPSPGRSVRLVGGRGAGGEPSGAPMRTSGGHRPFREGWGTRGGELYSVYSVKGFRTEREGCVICRAPRRDRRACSDELSCGGGTSHIDAFFSGSHRPCAPATTCLIFLETTRRGRPPRSTPPKRTPRARILSRVRPVPSPQPHSSHHGPDRGQSIRASIEAGDEAAAQKAREAQVSPRRRAEKDRRPGALSAADHQETAPCAQVRPPIHSASAAVGRFLHHQAPADHRERYEEDGGREHAGVHRGPASEQTAHPRGHHQDVQDPGAQSEHAHPAGWEEKGVRALPARCGCGGGGALHRDVVRWREERRATRVPFWCCASLYMELSRRQP
eukprot:ctg_1172.g370